MSNNDVVLQVNDLHTYFFNRRGITKAVDGISFTLREGETLGIVGESGCGKTMTALSLLGLVPHPGARITAPDPLRRGPQRSIRGLEDLYEFRTGSRRPEIRTATRRIGLARAPGLSPRLSRSLSLLNVRFNKFVFLSFWRK